MSILLADDTMTKITLSLREDKQSNEMKTFEEAFRDIPPTSYHLYDQ